MRVPKLLAYGDYTTTTGFSNVMSNILKRLDKFYDIDVLAINYDGSPDYDHERFPGRIWPACPGTATGPYADLYGRQKLLDLIRVGDYDKVFMLQDTFVLNDVMPLINQMRTKYTKHFKTIYYFPVDCKPMPHWIRTSVSLADIPVAYTQYGYNECLTIDENLKGKLKVVPHGIDLTDFYEISDQKALDEFYDENIPFDKERFIVLNVNRNQPRKDLERSLMLIKELNDIYSDNFSLILHASNYDVGGDLRPIAAQLGLRENIDYYITDPPQDGVPIDFVNKLYNIAHVVITTSLGEGWGLSLTEAMATKTMVAAPNHTSMKEIIDGGRRGIAIRSGEENPNLWAAIRDDNRILRPLTDINDMSQKIHLLYQNPDMFEGITDNAYNWVQTKLNWDYIAESYWLPIIGL